MKITSIYLSRIIGNKVYTSEGKVLGRLKDLAISLDSANPKVLSALVKIDNTLRYFDWEYFSIDKVKGQYTLSCNSLNEYHAENSILLKKYVLDKQIIDVNGKKVVRVNDVRLVLIETGLFVVAVDIGIEGILRRIDLAKPLKRLGINISSKLMLWNDVQTITNSRDLKISKAYDKLSTLHPSDLADIIEDFDTNTGMIIFSSLDIAKAADVLEELEEDAQVNVIRSLSPDKAADILEEMPADEVADILDGLHAHKVEELLNNMEKEASDEVRDLLEYDEKEVGSLMTTDFLSYKPSYTISEVIDSIRESKPEGENIHLIYIINENNNLLGTLSLIDVITSDPKLKLEDVMHKDFIFMYDKDNLESLFDIIPKYNLMELPILDETNELVGNVVVNDLLYEFIKNNKKAS